MSAQGARPKARIGPGVRGVSIVSVDHMTGGTPTGAIIPRVIVGPKEGEVRVIQTGLV
jgi:hypothetical protein